MSLILFFIFLHESQPINTRMNKIESEPINTHIVCAYTKVYTKAHIDIPKKNKARIPVIAKSDVQNLFFILMFLSKSPTYNSDYI